ncbi:hypothetical protein [Aestuariivirga sp.]|uniref:hypothetical protein n=1 Tax=Aestuariivirga sp. TaxID=2650926 RepID=UPI0039E40EDE
MSSTLSDSDLSAFLIVALKCMARDEEDRLRISRNLKAIVMQRNEDGHYRVNAMLARLAMAMVDDDDRHFGKADN